MHLKSTAITAISLVTILGSLPMVATAAPSISVSTNKNVCGPNETITFTATSPTVVKKINILVNARLAKECFNTNVCTYVGGPYTAFHRSGITYGANAYDEAGNRAWTGYKVVWIR